MIITYFIELKSQNKKLLKNRNLMCIS